MSRVNLISSMNIQQPYTSIIINAIGMASKFSSYVKSTDNKVLQDKYDKYLELKEKCSNIESVRKTEEAECKKTGVAMTKERKDYYKTEIKNIEKEEKKLNISKAEIMKGQNMSKSKKEDVKEKNYLDDWQKHAIDVILEGESVAIFGPTSGGKTYLVKYIVNELRAKKKIVYVAPTFHLALQTYADIQITYSGFIASLITDKITEYNKDSNIYVGTAEQLLNFVIGNNIKYDVGIFDEIHSISTSTFSDISRIRATTELLKLCKEQIIALSATVRTEDKPMLIEYIQTLTSKRLVDITYTNRIIPQEFYTFNGDILSTNKIYTRTDMNPEDMLKLCFKMKNSDMLPSLMFIMANTYEKFSEFVELLDKEETREYQRLHQLADEMNDTIFEYNDAVTSFTELVSDKNIDDLSKDLKKHAEHLKSRRFTIITGVKTRLETVITKLVVKLDNMQNYEMDEEVVDLSEPKYFVKNKEWIRNIPFKIVNDDERVDLKTIHPTPELLDLCGLYSVYANESFEEDNYNYLSAIPNGRGSYFNFGNASDHVLTSFNNKQSKQGMKIKNLIINMAKSEGLEEDDIGKFVSIAAKGLSFGIAALLKEFPFFIQYQIMELMKTKKLGLVFANESMSMGINYPLRSVVIASTSDEKYPVTNLLQMAGRCGRRGLDTKAYVITWGIKNVNELISQNIEGLVFDEVAYLLEKPEKIDEIVDKELLQNIYLRYHTTYSKEESIKLVKKYKEMCKIEYEKY